MNMPWRESGDTGFPSPGEVDRQIREAVLGPVVAEIRGRILTAFSKPPTSQGTRHVSLYDIRVDGCAVATDLLRAAYDIVARQLNIASWESTLHINQRDGASLTVQPANPAQDVEY